MFRLCQHNQPSLKPTPTCADPHFWTFYSPITSILVPGGSVDALSILVQALMMSGEADGYTILFHRLISDHLSLAYGILIPMPSLYFNTHPADFVPALCSVVIIADPPRFASELKSDLTEGKDF